MKTINTIIVTALIAITIAGCSGQQNTVPGVEKFIFNGNEIGITPSDYRIMNDKVYLAASLLEKQMHLKLDELVPGVQIGICTDELCIPFSLDPEDEQGAIKEGNAFFIPAGKLMESLGSKADWDKSTKTLTVTYGG